jgi:hypothetical protein
LDERRRTVEEARREMGCFFRRGRRQAAGNIDNGLKNEIVSIVAMFPIALDFVRRRRNREQAIAEPLSLQGRR